MLRQTVSKNICHAGIQVLDMSETQLKEEAAAPVKIHGISFSPLVEGQKPGDAVSKQQIEQRLSVIANSVHWIRCFSCTKGNEFIPEVAKSMGLKTLVGAWLDDDLESNEKEIENLITLGKAGLVDVAAVGNEVLLREELSEAQLIDYIKRVKAALPDIKWVMLMPTMNLKITPRSLPNAILSCKLLPFWEGCALSTQFYT